MTTFPDFIAFIGTQKAAGEAIGLSESMVSLIVNGKRPLLPEHAIRVERASDGLFKADNLLPEVEFTRGESGDVTGYQIRS